MSIADWTSERGLAAIEKTGVPFGLNRGTRHLLIWCCEGDTVPGDYDVVALALLRDHAREWLAKRGQPVFSIHHSGGTWTTEVDVGNEICGHGNTDFDLALVAAIEAAPAPAEAPQDGA